jgi:Protein of Unknown function (DUF2784)
MGLHVLDLLLTLFHFAIIAFNLFGCVWKATRKAHLICITITAGCWFILGIWFGIGYCPVTDWQWNIKEKLGETNLPGSFIKYYADKISGRDVNDSFIDVMTSGCFFLAAVLSVYVNFFKDRIFTKAKS